MLENDYLFNGKTSVLNIQSSYGLGIQFTKMCLKSVIRDRSPDRMLWHWHNMLVNIKKSPASECNRELNQPIPYLYAASMDK